MSYKILIIDNHSYNYSDKNLNVLVRNHTNIDKDIDFNIIFLSIDLYDQDFVRKFLNLNIPVVYIVNKDEEYLNVLNAELTDLVAYPLSKVKFLNKIKHYQKTNQLINRYYVEEELSEAILNTATNPVFLTDSEKFLYTNKSFNSLFNIQNAQEANIKFEKISDIFIKKPDLFYKSSWLEESKFRDFKVTIENTDKKEQTFIFKNNYLEKGNNYLIYLHDITHELEHESELVNLLYTDSTTKLPNRAKLIDQLQNGLLDITSLAIIDINSFKEINDFYGNKIGDIILYEIGQLIIRIIEGTKGLKLYKFPADIYCLTNNVLPQEAFTKLIEEIISLIDKRVFIFEQHEINTRVSVGISFSEKNNKLITADLALQAAKSSNKEYLVFFEELDNIQEYENNMLWTKKVKHALENDNIIVYYQPLINNKAMKIDKYECLVRLKDGDKIVSPFFFLDISKKSNQYTKITKVVIDKSCKAFANLPYEFSVNISYEDIVEPRFYEFIKEKIQHYGVENQIVFEILENENVKSYDVLISFIEKVKALGCKVAIDDFGSGYSNFEHLLKMNVDYLKIDASLIKNVAIDDNSYKITKTIIDFANNLNLKTIAEFVENKEIFDIVSKLSADYSQGYYFSAPLPQPNFDIEAHNE